ncbi:hypothetical protein [Rhizobium leguminosarum]|uniref:hypothetical protein n=1 Tax=Rhizobium leguminosarum TaxID=384 RepID=UPI0002D72986|nr:hypothetical protein [Rhizobium leguminosarum]
MGNWSSGKRQGNATRLSPRLADQKVEHDVARKPLTVFGIMLQKVEHDIAQKPLTLFGIML